MHFCMKAEYFWNHSVRRRHGSCGHNITLTNRITNILDMMLSVCSGLRDGIVTVIADIHGIGVLV